MTKLKIKKEVKRIPNLAWKILIVLILIGIAVSIATASIAGSIIFSFIVGMALKTYFGHSVSSVLEWIGSIPDKIRKWF